MSTGDPRLDELIAAALEARIARINTMIPGVVKAFDPVKRTVDVQPALNKVEERLNGERVSKPWPVIQNVRIAYPCGGGYVIRWPLQEGDLVELRFPQLDPTLLEMTGQVSDPQFLRHHASSRPMAWPTEFRLLEATADPTEIADALQLDGPGGVVVGKPLTAKAVALDELVDLKVQAAIAQHTHICAAPTVASAPGVLAGSLPSAASSNLKAEP